MRSPIERMIDEACGFVVQDPPSGREHALEVAALIELADAATAWVDGDIRGSDPVWAAAIKLFELGWREAGQ